MDSAELNEVCRLCPSSGGGEELMHVFDERLSVKNNMKEVILVTTGVEIQEIDLISKKICQRCCTKTLQMFLFRQDALTQDRALREKCSRFLEDKGIRLQNTCITIKRERRDSFVPPKRPKLEPNDTPSATVKTKPKKTLHPSVANIYKNYPHIKLPKKCLDRHLAPVVSFTMGEVEKYFKRLKLDMKTFIYKPGTKMPSRAVAKKRTSFPTKRKTVSPIKISKKVLENHDSQNTSNNIDYVCTSVHKDKEKKKSVSQLHADKQLPTTISHESIATQSPPSAKSVDTPKLPKVCYKNIPETQIPKLQPIFSVPQKLEILTTVMTPTIDDPISKDNQESGLSGTSKPEFIESLGLTPTVTATKSKMMHVCNLCGSVHNNAFKLKTHTRKHMVCQFCKLRFKTLESKQDHVDNSCHVKKILNLPGPVVDLAKIHLNLNVRKNFSGAFSDFKPISGLPELESIEQANVKVGAPPPLSETGNVILLSDDEDATTKSSDPSTDALISSDIPLPESVSVVRPDVKIKENSILDDIIGDIGDKQIVKDLFTFLKPLRRRTVEKVLQTDLPATKDIKINNAEGYCEFKNLKEQLLSYQIPVSITDGPFHVGYQYKNTSNFTKTMAYWDDIPVIDVGKKPLSKQNGGRNNPPLSSNSSTDKLSAINSQAQQAHSSGLSPITQKTSEPESVANDSSISASVGNASTSPIQLLQNYAQNTISPVINKSIAIPKSSASSALGYTASTSKRSLSLRGRFRNNRPVPSTTLSRKSLPPNLVPINGPNSSVVLNVTSSTASNITNNTAGLQPTVNSTRTRSRRDSASTSALENSRFRVKNVWELQ